MCSLSPPGRPKGEPRARAREGSPIRAGTLYLVPTTIAEGTAPAAIPPEARARIRAIRYFIAEEPKSARAFLKAIDHPGPMAELTIAKLAASPDEAQLAELLEPVRQGADAGVLAEAGAPAVADPGAMLVRQAHASRVRVAPLVGPSAILLALMASGLEGQRFAFHGYLAVDERALKEQLRALEADSRRGRRTELFIETPYRNDRLLRAILGTCAPDTLLCVAVDLTSPNESIALRTVAEWRAAPRAIGKRPAVFLLLAAPR
jgi:16S rRNA (cytidine1402-2'-O)-methyltransferase